MERQQQSPSGVLRDVLLEVPRPMLSRDEPPFVFVQCHGTRKFLRTFSGSSDAREAVQNAGNCPATNNHRDRASVFRCHGGAKRLLQGSRLRWETQQVRLTALGALDCAQHFRVVDFACALCFISFFSYVQVGCNSKMP